MRRLEELLGAPPEMSEQVDIFYRIHNTEASVEHIQRLVEGIQKSVEDMPSFVEGRVVYCQEEITVLIEAVESTLEGIAIDFRILKQALRPGWLMKGPLQR